MVIWSVDTLLKMQIFSILHTKPYSTFNKIAMIIRINGQAQSSWLKYYSEKCAVLVVEIAVGLQTRPLQYAWKLIKKTILPQNSVLKRCSRVETPQHRVLENTLNMGSILHGLKWFYSRWDAKVCKRDASQMQEVRTIMWWMWHGYEPCNHVFHAPLISCYHRKA